MYYINYGNTEAQNIEEDSHLHNLFIADLMNRPHAIKVDNVHTTCQIKVL
jgi:hypothetical protein